MEQETENIIATRLTELPENIQSLIRNPALITDIVSIAQKNNLPPEKTILLENEVMLVLLAFETIDNFEEHIVKELLIPGSIAASIAHAVKTTIFINVAPELEAIYLERATYEKENPTPQISPQIPLITRAEETPTVTPTDVPLNTKRLSSVPRYTEDPYHEPLG